jgi:hypothetical protein
VLVLGDEEEVDQADGVLTPQAPQLLEDRAIEAAVGEGDDEHLHRSERAGSVGHP